MKYGIKIKSLFQKNLILNQCIMIEYQNHIRSSNIRFYSNKMPKENECYTFLSVILLDSIINVDKKLSTNIFRRI